MGDFLVIKNGDPEWDNYVKSSFIYDFHHTGYYHKIDSDFESVLVVYKFNADFIALPLVLRNIPNSEYFDATSVYGYAGPIFKLENQNDENLIISNFKKEFEKFCVDYKIVSVFSRLHPIIEQRHILNDLGNIEDLNKTVSINLTLTNEEQRKEFRKSLKSDLSQLRRKDIKVHVATTQAEIDKFISIYYETMDRVNAVPYYYFSKEYFYEFLNNSAFKAKLLVATFDNEIIAGAIFTFTPEIMQYHLAGTSDSYIKDTPMKLILDEARILGNQDVAKYLHLGGGVGGSDDDSLFRFKSGFSKDFKQFSVWKYIANPIVYQELSKDKVQSAYFPLYRS